jgi:hypothetical protein
VQRGLARRVGAPPGHPQVAPAQVSVAMRLSPRPRLAGPAGQVVGHAWPAGPTRHWPPHACRRRSQRWSRGCEMIASRRCPPIRGSGRSRNRHSPWSGGTST